MSVNLQIMKLADTINTEELSVSEKIILVQDLWDEISHDTENILPSHDLAKELDIRFEDYVKNPEEGSSWSDAKKRILAQL
jgi:putative addiction module component (TIGR02574 family)